MREKLKPISCQQQCTRLQGAASYWYCNITIPCPYAYFSTGKTQMLILFHRFLTGSIWVSIKELCKHRFNKLLQLVVGRIDVFFRSDVTLTTLWRLMRVCTIYFLPLMSPLTRWASQEEHKEWGWTTLKHFHKSLPAVLTAAQFSNSDGLSKLFLESADCFSCHDGLSFRSVEKLCSWKCTWIRSAL